MKTILLGAVLIFLFCYQPAADPKWVLCGFHWLTGRPCPLCGMTRALCDLAKGNFRQAIHFHALSPLVFLIIVGAFLASFLRRPLSLPKDCLTAGCLLFLGYGLLRLF